MERLMEKLDVAENVLATLTELPLSDSDNDVIRDAAIQRFEHTFEAVWKAAQLYLRKREGLEEGSPKGVVRACLQVGVLTEGQARRAMDMIDDRNLTVHTYNVELARRIFSNLNDYAELMMNWLESMEIK